MANKKHIEIASRSVQQWNAWRKRNPEVLPNLKEADLRNRDLRGYDFSLANLSGTDLSGSDLTEANFHGADLSRAVLTATKLIRTNFCRADLYKSTLARSDLSFAKLKGSQLAETDFTDATLVGCEVYGSSAWDLKLENAVQLDLVISHSSDSRITVDNIEVAQFIYLLLHNKKIRDVIETIGKKAVLILGRFDHDNKSTLDGIRAELRKENYLPILFDFKKPHNRDLTETLSTLAHMSRFIIADLTNARSVPHELQAIVPNLPSVLIQPIARSSKQEYAMFDHIRRYPWVMSIHKYESSQELLATFKRKIISPIERKLQERSI